MILIFLFFILHVYFNVVFCILILFLIYLLRRGMEGYDTIKKKDHYKIFLQDYMLAVGINFTNKCKF